MRRRNLKNLATIVFLTIYCLITLVPFYFLIVRSFVPTFQSTELHLTIPERNPLSLNARIGDLATVYNLDTRRFKQQLGIEGYLDPQLSLGEIAERNDIAEERIVSYLEPRIHYNGVFTILQSGFIRSLIATVLVTAASIALGAILGIATGSVLAGFRRRWHLLVYNGYLLSIVIPPLMIILPQYLIMTKYLHLNNSYLAIVLLNVIRGIALSTMIFTSYIAAFPKGLRESVLMDGGNRLNYVRSVVFPLMATPFAVYASITLPWYWNDLLPGLVFLKPERYTLPPFLASIGGTFTTNFEAIFSGVLLSLVPILLVYLVLRRMFISSALAGAVKG